MAEAGISASPDVKLRRFLYTGCEDAHFNATNLPALTDYTIESVTCVAEYFKSTNPETLFNIIEIVNSEGLVARRETIFFVLAVAAASITKDPLMHRLYRTLSTVIGDYEELFTFVKYYTTLKKKFSSAINKFIRSYYNNKTTEEFLAEVTKTNGYHSWTHKDLFKLSHYKWKNTSTAVVVVYVLFGLKTAILVSEQKPVFDKIIDHLKKLVELKRCESEERVAELIPELHCPVDTVPSIFHNCELIWETLLPEMSVRDIILNLSRMYKHGLFKSSSFQNKVIENLTHTEKIQQCKVHPIEVFIGLRKFEKGGKAIDPKFQLYLDDLAKSNPDKAKKYDPPKDPPKYSNLVSALHKAMQISFENLQPWGRKVMITIDISKRMNGPCLSTKCVTCLDAATILTLTILRTEREVTVATFNDSKISIINLEKNITFNQALNKIKRNQEQVEYCVQSAPIDWAMNKKKSIDVFINIMFFHHWLLAIPKEYRVKEKPLSTLNAYRSKLSLPHAKLISFSLGSPKLQIADGSPNVLDICGMDKNVPKVVEAFSKGLF